MYALTWKKIRFFLGTFTKRKTFVNTRVLLYIVIKKNPENRQKSQKAGFKFYITMKIQRISDLQGRLSLFSPSGGLRIILRPFFTE